MSPVAGSRYASTPTRVVTNVRKCSVVARRASACEGGPPAVGRDDEPDGRENRRRSRDMGVA